MKSHLTRAFIQSEVSRLEALVPWYHRFEITPCDGDTVVISGWEGIYPVWKNIRSVRRSINYANKRVLDLGCRDGMWAFEAELFGAYVIATDIGCAGYREHASFIKSAISSDVGFYFNVPTEEAFSRLDVVTGGEPFDIVQHLGLLYHVQDPLRSLRETRRCLKKGGILLLETAYWTAEGMPAALFNSRSDVYDDKTTFWAMNLPALHDSLKLCGFDSKASIQINEEQPIGRACMIAEAV